jgi:hypothetical protein
VAGKNYTEDFDAENSPGQSFTWNSDEIQPDEARTGTVIFDIPNKHVSKLSSADPDALPKLFVANFSDADDPENADPVGIIRLYH